MGLARPRSWLANQPAAARCNGRGMLVGNRHLADYLHVYITSKQCTACCILWLVFLGYLVLDRLLPYCATPRCASSRWVVAVETKMHTEWMFRLSPPLPAKHPYGLARLAYIYM